MIKTFLKFLGLVILVYAIIWTILLCTGCHTPKKISNQIPEFGTTSDYEYQTKTFEIYGVGGDTILIEK